MRIPAPLRWLVRRASETHRALVRSGRAPRRLRRDLLLLTTRDRHSGEERTVPLFHVKVGEHFYVVPSFGGNDDPPGWYRNLRAEPEVVVETDGGRVRCRARTLEPGETVTLWPLLRRVHPGYAAYQRRTRRWIPVVELSAGASATSREGDG